jgi:hypothetical protein
VDIRASFEETGIFPPYSDVILNNLKNMTGTNAEKEEKSEVEVIAAKVLELI